MNNSDNKITKLSFTNYLDSFTVEKDLLHPHKLPNVHFQIPKIGASVDHTKYIFAPQSDGIQINREVSNATDNANLPTNHSSQKRYTLDSSFQVFNQPESINIPLNDVDIIARRKVFSKVSDFLCCLNLSYIMSPVNENDISL